MLSVEHNFCGIYNLYSKKNTRTMSEKFYGSEFVREIDIESHGSELKIHQYSVGDVGCVVWDAGIALAKYLDHLQKKQGYVYKKSAIDIGSGTGIVGLFAAALGANVILTDLPEFIPLLEKNIQSNKNVLIGSVSAAALSWGEDEDMFSPPDILLISDCIYYDKSVEKLITTIVSLSTEKTDVFISYEDRDLGNKKELLKHFLSALQKHFHVKAIPPNEMHPEFQSPDIHILKCKQKNEL